jgi:diketogulonate reductase-like aldo/keto reductase/PAS domain-containing protein
MTQVNIPTLEVLEGLHPSLEVKARVEELLLSIRESMRSRFRDSQCSTSASILADGAEKEAMEWLKAGNGGGMATEPNAPPSGLKAAKEFEQNDVWSCLLSSSDQRLALASETTAWTVADKEAEDWPLVYMTPQFSQITGYSIDWMLGRNCRFLQPSDCGRNEVFNGDERKRMREFCKGRDGTLTSLVLNQKANGSFFWNLIVLEHVVFRGHAYILAANKGISLHQELLSMMNTWDHRSLGYITSLRMLLKMREAHLSPMPSRTQANEPMIAECFTQWSDTIRQDLSDFWEGDHFVPPIGGLAVQAFEGRWTALLQIAEENIRKLHLIQEATLINMRENKSEGGIFCAVSDPSAPDCPLVFVSKEFERATGYQCSFACGRNCRFLQPNNLQFNITINGDEIAQMRHFCTHLADYPVGSAILTLLLNEAKNGERFWNLLHMTHVDVAGRRYILGVQTVLELPMPGFLKLAQNATTMKDMEAVMGLSKFLADLRTRLQVMAKDSHSVKELSKQVLDEIHDYIKHTSDDFEGDHYVPKLGLAEAQRFESDKKWSRVFAEVAEDMQEIFEATEESYRNTDGDKDGSAACVVCNPAENDCAMLYISRGFEELTGYHRDWALGRNCRFLQPNAKAYNDAYNLWERSQMRVFCTLPAKPGRQLVLLVNEARDGYPFWNALVMKHIRIGDTPYIFGVQTNVMRDLELLGELLAGGPDGFAELGRLRSILRAREAKLGTYSLATLVNEALVQWKSTLAGVIKPSRWSLPQNPATRVPTIGLELARHEIRSIEEKVLSALDEGVRHFHLNFASKSSSQTRDVEGRLFALRLVEALAVLKQRHLHYLRDCMVFSVRAEPNQLNGSLEILKFLQTTGFHVCLWLLDVSKSTPKDVSDSWPALDQAVRDGKVEAVGLFGGGHAEFAAASMQGYVKPAVQALDMYIGVNFNCRQWVHITKLVQAGVMVMTCKPFGPQGSLLSNPQIRLIAQEKRIDPAIVLMKWAEGLGYLCVVPTLRTSQPAIAEKSIGVDTPFVLNGTRRNFIKEYDGAPGHAILLQQIKRRFPQTALDHVRYQGGQGERPAPGAQKTSQAVRRTSIPGSTTSASKSAGDSPKKFGGDSPKKSPQVERRQLSTMSPMTQRPTAASAVQRIPSVNPRDRAPATNSCPVNSWGMHDDPKRPTNSRIRASSPNSTRTSTEFGGFPGTPTSHGQASKTPLSGMGPKLSSVRYRSERSPSPVKDLSPPSPGPAENTDVDRSAIESRQRELAKREVELMLKQVQLEQKLLKEEQRLLRETSAKALHGA